MGETKVLSKKDAWELIDEKIRIAEERKQNEDPGSIENKGNKKSHFWLDFRVLICIFFYNIYLIILGIFCNACLHRLGHCSGHS